MHEADRGDATESQEPGDTGTGRILPEPRRVPERQAATGESTGMSPARASTAGGPGGASALARTADGSRAQSELADAELLRLHVAGDADAFGRLFLRHRERLWAIAVRTLHDPEDAADALQDAMISAFRRAGSFRGDSAVTTWLHRIVVNACLDRIRRRSARPEISGGDERLLDVMAAPNVTSDPAPGTEVSLEVKAALRELPRDQRIALVLVDMLDYPVAEAAEVLGVAQGTVKSRCARGRARLLPRLAHLRQSAGSGPAAGGSGPAGGGPGRPGGTAQRRGRGFPGLFGWPPGNRFGSGNVLPAREGGDEVR